jgi:hypothetical protein
MASVGERREQTRERIEKAFDEAIDKLGAYQGNIDSRVHVNKDGTIDGELRVYVRRGEDPEEVLTDIENAIGNVPNTWISTGVRFASRGEEDLYTKFQGMSQAQTYYQRNVPSKSKFNFEGGRVIVTRLKQRGRRKPQQVFVRFAWNPEGTQPSHPLKREREQKKYRHRK